MRVLILLPALLWFASYAYVKAKPRPRPEIAKLHDAAWGGPAGRARKREFAKTHPPICARCSRAVPQCHHLQYFPGATGHEPDWALVWLCDRCHRLVHRRHDTWFPFDRWPYRRLWLVTNFTIRNGRRWYRLWRPLPEWMFS